MWIHCKISSQTYTHLPIKACCHSDDVTSLVVNGKYVGGGALGILGKDLVSQHPIGHFWIIFVHCCHCHHKGSCRETHSKSIYQCMCARVCACVRAHVPTRFGSLRNRTIEDGVYELWPVIILVDNINDDVNGVLNLIPIQVHSMGSQLYTNTHKHI